jgi:hypothetical protein
VDYSVSAELEPPVGVTELDALQQEGVASILDRHLALVEGVSGPDGTSIDVLDFHVAVHSRGANVVLSLEAPSLMAAENAAASVLNEMISENELLTGWLVTNPEVQLTEDEFNERLAAAGLESVESNGEVQPELSAAVEEALEGQQPAMTADQWRTELLKFAPQLRAFSPRDFAPGQPEELNRLASGALVHAIRVVTDEIFYDELALAINNATVADAIGLLVLEELPPCYDHRYDSAFARAFLLASSMVATRLTSPDWRPPRTVAEALALQLFINEARVVLEATELLSWDGSEPLFAEFSRQAFAELNPAELYEVEVPVTDGGAESSARAKQTEAGLRAHGLAYEQWFIPRDGAAGMHPYLPFE